MCPQLLAVAGFVVSAASTVMGFAAQEAQANAQDAAWQQNYVSSLAAARDSQNTLTLRQMQEADAASQKSHIVAIQTAQKGAEVAAAAGSGGVSGTSVDSLIQDVNRQGGLNQLAIQRNFEATVVQLQREKEATNDAAMSRINSMSRGNHPNPLAAGIAIAGAGLDSYNQYQKSQNPTG